MTRSPSCARAIVSGASIPSRSSTVGATSTMFTNPARPVVADFSSPLPNPGARTAATVSATSGSGAAGPTTITASRVVRSTCRMSFPTSRSVSRNARSCNFCRACSDENCPSRSARTRSDPSTSTTVRPGRPTRRGTRSEHRIVVEPDTERAVGVRWRSSRSTLSVGHLARAGHQRAHRRAPRTAGTGPPACSGSPPSPLAITARDTPARASGSPSSAHVRRRSSRRR